MTDAIWLTISGAFGDDFLLMKIVAVTIALSGIGFIVVHLQRAKHDVQRRVMADPGAFASTTLSARARVANRFVQALEGLGAATSEGGVDDKNVKQLRGKLIQAGFYDRRAVAFYFGLRMALAIVGVCLGLLALALTVGFDQWTRSVLVGVFGAMVGYIGPMFLLDRRIKKRMNEYREGFPDFMDLLVVCAQAGLSMEAGVQRIAGELKTAYPALASNLELTSIEIRSGKTMSKAMEALSRRLGIEEATSFSTLLTQSEELGSSLSQSLRAYSDDMRNKRLMKAEEKAFALPAKLVVPLTLFVFPTLMVVLLLPVVVNVSQTKF